MLSETDIVTIGDGLGLWGLKDPLVHCPCGKPPSSQKDGSSVTEDRNEVSSSSLMSSVSIPFEDDGLLLHTDAKWFILPQLLHLRPWAGHCLRPCSWRFFPHPLHL